MTMHAFLAECGFAPTMEGADASLFRAALYHLSYLATVRTFRRCGLSQLIRFTLIRADCKPKNAGSVPERAERFDYSNHTPFAQRSLTNCGTSPHLMPYFLRTCVRLRAACT
jgi:hypothetical protein